MHDFVKRDPLDMKIGTADGVGVQRKNIKGKNKNNKHLIKYP